jgi:hypothetical protein
MRREHAIVDDQILVRSGHERGQPFDERRTIFSSVFRAANSSTAGSRLMRSSAARGLHSAGQAARMQHPQRTATEISGGNMRRGIKTAVRVGAAVALLVACSGGSDPTPEPGPSGGTTGMTAGAMGGAEAPQTPDGKVSVILAAQLAQPSDLEFNPYVNDELWIMNYSDSSVVIISNASTAERSAQRRLDVEASSHFMPRPTAFAFGGRETTIVDAQGTPVEGTFATCPGSSEGYMGPTLWTSDLRIFAIAKPDREPPFNGPDTGAEGPGSHIDMLHRTPACTGIAWEGAGSVYWTYSAFHAKFVKYDFAKDHGIGNDNHSDGSVWRYPVTGLQPVAKLPTHVQYDAERKLLYMADTGNSRVVTFDPTTATESSMMNAIDNVDGLRVAFEVEGGQLQDLVPSSYGLKSPIGLEIHEDKLYVSDNETSTIHRFSLDGTPLGKVVVADVKPGGLAGLAFGPDGKLYFVDMQTGRVLRLENAF